MQTTLEFLDRDSETADSPKELNADIDLHSYDHIIVAFSGGKDSTAAVLHLLDHGVDPDRIELWHHEVDGREDGRFFDWPVTTSYCEAFAEAFGMDLYFSWRVKGFAGELLKQNDRTKPVRFERPDGTIGEAGGKLGKVTDRLMWPAVSANLMKRWCSGVLKIDVGRMAITNQERFEDCRTLFITGERAQESASRAKYNRLEPHATDNRNGSRVVRRVDHWRAVHDWTEREVWGILKRYAVNPHPAYSVGFGRTSCAYCIFGSENQAASLREMDPDHFEYIAGLEEDLDHTIHDGDPLASRAERGTPYDAVNEKNAEVAFSEEFNEPIILDPAEWKEPAGAYGENCGAR